MTITAIEGENQQLLTDSEPVIARSKNLKLRVGLGAASGLLIASALSLNRGVVQQGLNTNDGISLLADGISRPCAGLMSWTPGGATTAEEYGYAGPWIHNDGFIFGHK